MLAAHVVHVGVLFFPLLLALLAKEEAPVPMSRNACRACNPDAMMFQRYIPPLVSDTHLICFLRRFHASAFP